MLQLYLCACEIDQVHHECIELCNPLINFEDLGWLLYLSYIIGMLCLIFLVDLQIIKITDL